MLQDDRFVAKRLSKQELQAMETICPPYFSYMSSVISTNVSTVMRLAYCIPVHYCFQRFNLLAKMLGCYKVTFHYASAGKKSKATQMNLLILENVLYDRQFSKVDLFSICRAKFELIRLRRSTS
jgi:1-phosphatidylinositol-3-phosphate 5-kinase